MATTYPNGYGKQLLTLDELRAKHEPKMQPEYARRLFACIKAADGLVGIGESWRSAETQAESHARDPQTFAPPGLSFHESQTFAAGASQCAAVDTVGRDGRHDSAWSWLRNNAARFGLRTFWDVNGEPWHVQCNDIPNGVKEWKQKGSPEPPRFALPDGSPAAATESGYGLYPFDDHKPVLRNGLRGSLVEYAQRVIFDKAGGGIDVDGEFGSQTEGRVKDVQTIFGLPGNGVVDWDGTWQAIDLLAGYKRPARPDQSIRVMDVDLGYYWVRRGDSPWIVAERVWGKGQLWEQHLNPCRPESPAFTAADHHVRLPGVAGRTTVVVPGDEPHTIVRRLYPRDEPAGLVDRFVELNGGPTRTLNPGDLVYLDRPA